METIHIRFVSVIDDRGWFVADIPMEEHIYYRLRKENNLLVLRAPPSARDKRKQAEGAAPVGKRSRGARMIQFVQNTE